MIEDTVQTKQRKTRRLRGSRKTKPDIPTAINDEHPILFESPNVSKEFSKTENKNSEEEICLSDTQEFD